jgi:predicted peroxiredoxin
VADALGILLISGSHERAHYAFVLATGAAAIGRNVVLFATNSGCHALLADWRGLEDADRDAVVVSRGVAGFDDLRAAAVELGVRLLVCEAGLLAEQLEGEVLFRGVQIAGVATFLSDAADGQLLSL